jgi:Cu/Zn superoxide dismutase
VRAPPLVAIVVGLLACGGKPNKPKGPPPPDPLLSDEDEPPGDIEPEPEPEPPPPQRWTARAALAPVKGAKVKARVVTFTQVEGSGTAVTGDDAFDGLKAGTYHLVVHESPECGKNASKVGAMLAATSEVALKLFVEKGQPASLEEIDVELMLAGKDSIVGHSLVLHEDKKGKAGKALACGSIIADESDDEEMSD